MNEVAIAIGLIVITAIITTAIARRPLHRLIRDTQTLVRDPARRLPTISGA